MNQSPGDAESAGQTSGGDSAMSSVSPIHRLSLFQLLPLCR